MHHFVDLLDELKEQQSRMAAMVQQVVQQSMDAAQTLDSKLALQVVAADARIDEEEVKIEKSAIDLLALHAPAAGDLRTVTTIIKVNGELERIADCAVNIAQRVPPLSHLAGPAAPEDMRLLANCVVTLLRDTIKALSLGDEGLARQVLRSDDVIDALYHQIVQDMLTCMETAGDKVNADLAYIMIAKNLERIGDHCTNIAESVIFIHTGQIIRHQHNTA